MVRNQDNQSFEDSQEASFRRLVRDKIRKANFTKAQRDIVLAFINHWFQHRNKAGGIVHPGRKKLAAKAKASVETVKRTLALLRDAKAITATAHLNGLHGNATEYGVSIPHLMALCDLSKEAIRVYGGSNDPTTGRVKMTHRINNVVTFPVQRRA